ncbi:MAG: Lon family ATP-dependent protease [Carboxydocellales bacterium]
MKYFLERFTGQSKAGTEDTATADQLKRQVHALFTLLSNLYGSDRLVMKAGKLDALNFMRSELLEERVVALQRIAFEDPTIDKIPELEAIPQILDEVNEEIADLIARRTVEDKLERKVAEKMQERHDEYVREIRQQVVKDNTGPENEGTLKKLAFLEELESKQLARSAMEILRPASLAEIIGQDGAVQALVSKLASPFPQHIILYGPPGVGKTTAARLALEAAKKVKSSPYADDAPFIEVDGSTLRWDYREVTNPLLGSVHDPIYQGARRDLADSAIPEPKLGLVTDAHGGALFIDEIGELDFMLQNKLLKVLEDKKVHFDSSYYDPSDPNMPQWIKKVFEEGAPADFVLIGATTRDPSQINSAIRSRCAEVFFEPLTPVDIQEIIRNSAIKLGVRLAPEVGEIISRYTIEGRKAINILADAYGLVLYRASLGSEQENVPNPEQVLISKEDIYQVVQTSRISPYVQVKVQAGWEVGRIFGLGVSGFLGSVIEIEAAAFPARKAGQGSIRFNDTAGSMAKDSVFNAAAVIRWLSGEDINNYDIHVNIVGGGQIDGPSAGTAILLAILSAIQKRPICQDVAVTGEISIQGKVKPVGGVVEKIYGAKQAGIRLALIPKDNVRDIPRDLQDIEVTPVESVEEVLPLVFADTVGINPKLAAL